MSADPAAAVLVLEDGRTFRGRGVRRRRRDLRRGGLHHRDDRLPGDADRPVLPPAGRRADRAAHRQHRRQRRGRRVGPDLGRRLRRARPAPRPSTWRSPPHPGGRAGRARASSASAASTPARSPGTCASAARCGSASSPDRRPRGRPDELLAIVRAAPEMAGAHLADEVSTDRAVRRGRGGRAAVHRRRARPRHQGDDPAPDGRARHRGARAAGDRRPSTRCWPCSRTASSSPTARATRRPPTPRSRCCGRCSAAASRSSGSASATSCSAARSGLGTYKLGYGHRGINQPVLDRTTGKVEVTAHNHGFAVDAPLDGAGRHAVRRGRGHPRLPERRRRRGPAADRTGRSCRRSRCSTTRRRRPARTTPATCSTGSST